MKSAVVPPEARAMIGKRTTPHTYEVTKWAIKRFAQAIGDPNPLYVDETYAKKTNWEGIVAPPLFVFTFAYEDVPENQLREDGWPFGGELDIPLPMSRGIGGASAIELGEPIRPGDAITVRKKVADVYCKEGKSGVLYFIVIDITYTNQKGKLVAREKATFIQR